MAYDCISYMYSAVFIKKYKKQVLSATNNSLVMLLRLDQSFRICPCMEQLWCTKSRDLSNYGSVLVSALPRGGVCKSPFLEYLFFTVCPLTFAFWHAVEVEPMLCPTFPHLNRIHRREVWAGWYLLSHSHSHLRCRWALRKLLHLLNLVQKPWTHFGYYTSVFTPKNSRIARMTLSNSTVSWLPLDSFAFHVTCSLCFLLFHIYLLIRDYLLQIWFLAGHNRFHPLGLVASFIQTFTFQWRTGVFYFIPYT